MSSVHNRQKHGCKYAEDDTCPGALGTEVQEYKQECCDWEDTNTITSRGHLLSKLPIDDNPVIKEYLEKQIKELSK